MAIALKPMFKFECHACVMEVLNRTSVLMNTVDCNLMLVRSCEKLIT